jgi:acetyl esterase
MAAGATLPVAQDKSITSGGLVPLDPILDQVLQQAPPLVPEGASAPQVRETLEELAANPDLAALAPRVGLVDEWSVRGPAGKIPMRVYRPVGRGPWPVLVFFHGGGWVIGSVRTHDIACRELCMKAGVVVVSVDYRLAPEHPFPAGLDDCLAVTRWVQSHTDELDGNPKRIVVGGDSAGGNFAAVISGELAEDRPLAGQLLVYPATDMTAEYPSMSEFASGYFLDAPAIEFFTRSYVTDPEQVGDPRMSPIHNPKLSALPPTVVITAEYDPLRDSGEAYAAALRDAGVPVTARRFDGLTHGFLHFGPVAPTAQSAVDDTCELLKTLVA